MGSSRSTASRNRAGRQAAAIVLLLASALGARAEGLVLRAQETAGWHTVNEYALTSSHTSGSAIHLFGDYYFFDPAQSNLGPTFASLLGGFRASTGLLAPTHPLPLSDARPDPLQNLPYIGLGYSHLWFNSQLALNADFGLASQAHGRGLFNNANSLDEVTSQLRWAPVMAVNVRYSF